MKTEIEKHCYVLYCSMIFALLVFLYGFFPLNNKLEHKTSQQSYTRQNNSMAEKLVLIVIDGIREDFVNPAGVAELRFPFLQTSILKNESCFIPLRAPAPTVTLPRIKAITSGAIPVYLDVVLNLGSEEFHQDTFLRQAFFHGLRMVFYGDDTWIKMFPSLFVRKKGTHSFFAADFWEVDSNVTEQIDKELLRNDWDVLIAHYLGLDHIGHMEGPQSGHVPRKLRELDYVIQKISLAAQKWENTLVVVTGDHGMKDSGGHGGVTHAEVIVPLVTVGRPCVHLPGWPSPNIAPPPQIDLASTLAFALGLPIPHGNVGKLIPTILNGVSHVEIFKKLKEINNDLLKKSGSREMDDTLLDIPNLKDEAIRKMSSTYYNNLSSLSAKLTRQNSDFSLFYMISSNSLLILLFLAALIFAPIPVPRNPLQLLLLLGMAVHTISLGSSSFIEEEHQTWYFLWATFLLLSFKETWKVSNLHQATLQRLFATYWPLLILCVLHRVLREMNRTGDKWAHLPDLEDYLRTNQPLLLFTFLLGTALWYFLFTLTNRTKVDKGIYLAAILSIVAYRLAVGSFDVFPLKTIYPKSRGKFEVAIFLCIFVFFVYRTIRQRLPASWAWALLYGLTLRPHNGLLLPAQIFISRQLYRVFVRDEDHFWNTLAHIWSGYMFYFYQGNSNSLANVDVAPAFIASDKYVPIYAAIMTAAHTYAGPIQAILLSPMSYRAILFSRLVPSSMYCLMVTFLRHHLFVWSVFSPKLLIDTALSLVIWMLLSVDTTLKIYGVTGS